MLKIHATLIATVLAGTTAWAVAKTPEAPAAAAGPAAVVQPSGATGKAADGKAVNTTAQTPAQKSEHKEATKAKPSDNAKASPKAAAAVAPKGASTTAPAAVAVQPAVVKAK